MTFAAPWMLVSVLAVPAIVAAYVWTRRRRAQRSAELVLQGLVTSPGAAPRRRHVPFALLVAALAVLGLALARPSMKVGIPRMQGTVVLAFDVSNSMVAGDLEPSRIKAAQAAARRFVRRQPSTIRVGVVAFGDGAVVVQAPTHEKEEALAAIGRLSVAGGTSLGQGLFASLGAIAGRPVTIDEATLRSDDAEVDIGYFGSSVVVLLSDGENTTRPDPLAVAELASAAGVRVHTIGLGTEDGAVVKIDGFNVATALDRDILEQIASVTGGRYHEARDVATLAKIYRTIDLELVAPSRRVEVTGLFTAAAALLLLAGTALSVVWFGRVA